MSKFSPQLGALILLLIDQQPALNRTRLNKLCFFADVACLMQHRESISRSEYHKLPYGPVPADMNDTRAAMLTWGYLTERFDSACGYQEYTYQLGSVDLDRVRSDTTTELSRDKLAVVNQVATQLGGLSGSALSEASHSMEPWMSARMGQKLDLQKAVTDSAVRHFLVNRRVLPS